MTRRASRAGGSSPPLRSAPSSATPWWTTREAAYHGAPADLAAGAAISASQAAHRVFFETHQLTGAMGFTLEYDLHLWTMRLQTLRHEMQGMRTHARDLVAARWPAAS